MELKRLTIDGFRGLYTELDFSHNTIIKAGNGKGKTTIMNAILWLLCGSDDADRTNYNLFDNNLPSDDPYAPLTISVQAEFDTIVLKRTAKQLWAKDKNDKTKYVRNGDDYKYYVNDMEVNAKRFKEIVEGDIMPISKLKFVLNLHYWEILGEKGLREQIKDLAPSDLKPTDSRYDGVLWAINENGIIDAKKHFLKRTKECEKEASNLNIEIMASRKRLPQQVDVEPLRKQLEEAQSELDELNRQIAASVPMETLEKRRQEEQRIYDFKLELQNAKAKYNNDNKVALIEAESKLKEVRLTKKRISDTKSRIVELYKRLDVLEVDYKQKQDEYVKVQKRVFTGMCPTCGRALEGNNRVEQLNVFKAQKQREETNIIAEGQRLKSQCEETKKEIENYNNTLNDLIAESDKANKLEMAYNQAKGRCEIPFEHTDEYAEIIAKISELEFNRTELPKSNTSDADKARKGDLITKIQELQSNITIGERDNKEHERIMNDIKRLENNKESALRRMAENDRDLSLVKEYEAEWMSMLEDEINSNFSDIRIQMNDISKSGEITDCCKIRMADVKDTLNNASRIIVGISISEAIQKKYATDLPVLIDECESMEESKIPYTPHQMIRFYVDQNGHDLKIEHK